MNINIRKATENDIEIMTLIYNDSIKIFPPDQSAEGTKEIFAKTYNNDTVFIAEKTDTLETVGWISYNRQKKYILISGFYLLLKEQRKGIGANILDYCINIWKKNNDKFIILKALKNAPWSIDFYKKNNFLIYKTNKKYEHDLNFLKSVKIDRWEILMYRKIPKSY